MVETQPVSFKSEGLEINGILRETNRPTECAVVFCHGAFESQKNWFDFAEKIRDAGYASFTFDFAGHGASQGLRNLVNLRTWAYNIRDALTTLQTFGYKEFALVGWASGGSAVVLAAAHDPRLSCAVILSAPVFLQPPLSERVAIGLFSLVARIKKWIFHRPLMLSRLNELNELRILSSDAANEAYFSNPEVREIYSAVPIPEGLDRFWVDITQTASKITIPVLILHGAEDKIVPPEQSRRLYSLVSGPKEIKTIPNCGHAVHLDQGKDAVFEMIADWIKANTQNR